MTRFTTLTALLMLIGTMAMGQKKPDTAGQVWTTENMPTTSGGITLYVAPKRDTIKGYAEILIVNPDSSVTSQWIMCYACREWFSPNGMKLAIYLNYENNYEQVESYLYMDKRTPIKCPVVTFVSK